MEAHEGILLDRGNIITIVSGVPRSGTSMMMKMLEAGGMGVVQDGIRKADEDNPRGYYEFEKVKDIVEDSSWLEIAKGKVIKILFNFLYHLPSDNQYKIIFMQRNMAEIIASQNKMLERRSQPRETSDEEIAQLLNIEIENIKKWMAHQNNFEVLYIQYADVLSDPNKISLQLNEFICSKLNANRMTQVVDKSLYRQKSSSL